MQRLGAGLPGGLDQPFDVEVGIAGARGAEQHGFIGERDMQRIAVGLGIDSDGLQSHGPRSADDTHGDLAAVGDQELAKTTIHSGMGHDHILNRPNLVGSTGALAAADNPSPSTSRVSAGSITPSSHSRAVA